MVEFDPTDRRILTALQRDSDIAIEQLGKVVGLSRNACWRRIKQMEEAGIIRGRVALLDPDSVGLGLTVFIALKTDHHEGSWVERFTRAVNQIPEILGAYRTSGDLDYLLHARVADVKAYDRLYQKLIRSVPVKDVSASFVMEEIKETTALPVLEV